MNYSTNWLLRLECTCEKQIFEPVRMALLHRNRTLIPTFVVLVLISTSAFAAQASEETIATYKAAIDTFKAIEHPLTGRGSAISETYDRHPDFGSHTKIIDFMFKGDLSRSTRFSIKEGKRD